MRRLIASAALVASGIVAAADDLAPEALQREGKVAMPLSEREAGVLLRACAAGCAILTIADADKLEAEIAAMRAVVRRLMREAEEARKAEAARRCS